LTKSFCDKEKETDTEKIMFVGITGCAVAQHCYNGDVSFLWEKWKL